MLKSMVAAGLFLTIAGSSALAIEPCPEETQALLLTKAVSLTKQIGGSKVSKLSIGVLGGGPMVALLQKEAKASKAKIDVRAVEPANAGDVQVLFIPLGTSVERLEQSRDAARKAKVMTVSGNPQDALDHGLTLSFHAVGDKSRFIINLTAGATEQVEFEPQLLKIADRLRKD